MTPATPATVIVCTTPERAASLARTLDALRWLDYPAYEVVVVASGFGPDDARPAAAPGLRIVESPERNLSAARNAGIRAAAGEIVAFIDDDAVPEPDWLRALADALAQPEVAAAGGPVLDPSGVALQVRYSLANALGDVRGEVSGPNPSDLLGSPFSDWAVYTIGTNAAFRRSALVDIGGFDEEFEYYLDETDVCRRLLARGWIVRAVDAGYVHHGFLPNALRDGTRALATRYSIVKNRTYFAYRHGRDLHAASEITADLDAFAELHRDDCRLHIRAGNLPPETIDTLEREIGEGRDDGFAAFLRGPRTREPSWFGPRRAPLVAYRSARADRPLHLVFIAPEWPPLPLFGIARVVRSLALSLSAKGHVVRVLTPATHAQVEYDGGLWVHRVPLPTGANGAVHPVVAQGRAFAAVLGAVEERLPIDVVQAPNWDAPGLEAIAEGRWRVVVGLYTPVLAMVASDHRFHVDDSLIRLLGERELGCYASASAFLGCGDRIVDEIERDYGVVLRDRPVGIVPHGLIDLPRPAVTHVPDGTVRILYVGRLEPRKGVDVLLEAAARVLAEAPKARLLLAGGSAGGGPARSYPSLWRELAPDAEVAERATFLGQVDNEQLLELYARADIVVVPSRFESFGLTALEAMRYGVPAVVSATGEMQDIVGDAGCGSVVPPEDPEALADALLALVRDPERRAAAGRAGRAAFAERYTRERMADDVDAFFRRLVSEAGPTTGIRPADVATAPTGPPDDPLALLACPVCRGPLAARDAVRAGGRRLEGLLLCPACDATAAVVEGGRYDFHRRGPAPTGAAPAPLELPMLGERRIDATAGALETAGAWVAVGTRRASSAPGATLRLEALCSAALVRLVRHPGGGIARLRVDGATVAEVDLYEVEGSIAVPVRMLAASPARRHVLEVEVTGEAAPGAADAQVLVEEIVLELPLGPGADVEPRQPLLRGNDYSRAIATALAEAPADAWILEFGGGERRRCVPRHVNFEYLPFESADVLGDGHRLPFADEAFDLVVSQAVLEHLYHPFEAAREMVRVTRPGGLIVAEAAFMQPLHAVPSHYFNMTPWGIAELFEGCETLESDWFGELSFTVDWLLRAARVHERVPASAIAEVVDRVRAFDALVPHDDLRAVASGVYVVVRKPVPAPVPVPPVPLEVQR